MKIAYLAGIGVLAIASLAGCAKEPPPVERIVAVPSSKPYRYVTYSKQDSAETVAQIDRHNKTHARVKAAEKAAAKK